jgi:hypothetical protein
LLVGHKILSKDKETGQAATQNAAYFI